MCHKFISALFIVEIIMLSNSSCVKAAEENYNIHFEDISSSTNLKTLERNYPTLLSLINKLISRANMSKSYGDDYPLLTEKDINFTENADIHAIMVRDNYHTLVYNSPLKIIKANECIYWDVQYLKNNVMYSFKLYENDPPTMSQTIYYRISEDWFMTDFSVAFLDNIRFGQYRLYPNVVLENTYRLLPESDKSKRIDMIRTSVNLYDNPCYIICVEGRAKYIYCITYNVIPFTHYVGSSTDDIFYDGVSEKDKQTIMQLEELMYNNFDSNTPDIKQLYPYNIIVFITNYTKSKVKM